MKWSFKKYPMNITGEERVSKASVIGNLVFLSGLSGIDLKTGKLAAEKFDEQLISCLNNIRDSLEEVGSSLENMVKLLILIKDIKHCPDMWMTLMTYYSVHAPELAKKPPAVTVLPVNAFLDERCLVSIDVIAVLSKSKPGWRIKKRPFTYLRTHHTYPNIKKDVKYASESVAVGNLLFLSGMGGESPRTGRIETKDFETQMDIGFDKIRLAFDNAGSSVSNIIKTLHLLAVVDSQLTSSKDVRVSYSPSSDHLWKRELEHYEIYAPSLLDDFPGSTFLKLPSLEDPSSLVEIDIVGVISLDEPEWEVKKYPLYLGKRGFPRHIGEIKKYYANSVVVGNIIFISGQTPTDLFTGRIEADTFEEQMKVALDNLRMTIEETGSSLNNLAKTYMLLPDAKYYPIMRKMELEYYQKYAPRLVIEPPASTVINPLNLASPKMMIEIDAIGFLPKH